MEELQKLKNYQGYASSIISMTFPTSTKISDVVAHLQSEYSLSGNIKDKRNRKSVQDAIKMSIEFFRKWKELPETGLAIYSGQYV